MAWVGPRPQRMEVLGDGSGSKRVEVDGDTLVRLKPLRCIDRVHDAVNQGSRPLSTVQLLVPQMHDQADVPANIMRTTTRRIDVMEDILDCGDLFDTDYGVGPGCPGGPQA